ncbi:hypothetical protein BDV93DRAFT_524390 [Ceratobasidium sp. AG-I]|nr:hypothetical protein BDV93DRAFT_524390 [Ceratobasidium sp. AG-I]
MGMVVPPKDKPVRTHPPTPPETSSSVASPVPALRVTEATPQKKGKRGDGERIKRKSTRRKQGEDQADIPASVSAPARLAPASGLAPTPTSTAALPAPAARPAAERVIVAPSPTVRASPDLPALPELQPPAPARDSSSSTVHSPAIQPTPASPIIQPVQIVQPTQTFPTTQSPPSAQPQVSTPPPSTSSFSPEAESTLHTSLEPAPVSPIESASPLPESRASPEPANIGSAALDHDDVIIPREEDKIGQGQRGMSGMTTVGQEDEAGAVLPTTEAVSVLPLETTTTEPTPTLTAAMPLVKPRPGVERTPTVSKPRETKSRITSSASEPLVLSPTRANSKAGPKRRVASGLESAGETSGTDRGGRKKASAKRKTAPTPKRQPSAEERAGLAAMLRDADAPSPHVHFPAAGGMYVPSAPPVTKQPGALFLPTSGGGTTRSDVGPARSLHFDTGASALPPPSPVTVTRGRSGSGSVSFFGRVAGLFGRKKNSVDDYVPSGGGAAWRTRTDGNLARGGGADSSDDEPRTGLVAVSNVNTPAGRPKSVDNKAVPDSPKRGVGRKLTKADKGQTLRVGPPPIDTDMSARNRKSSLTGADRDERFEVASPVGGAGKGKKARGEKVRSVDGGGLSRKGSLKSNTSEPVSTTSGRTSSDKKRGAASLMALVEGPGLVLPSELAQRSQSPVPPKRRTDSPARGQSPARSQTPQSLLSVPPARMVSPTTTAAPKPVRAASPMPLKSAMRRTPSPMPNPPTPVDIPILSSPPSQDTSPVATSPTTGLSVPPIKIDASSPRNSIVAESLYETGEEDFDDATDGEAESDGTVAHADAPKQDSPAPAHAIIPPPAHVSAASPSAGTALAAFKSTISAPNSDTAMSVSTAGPYSAGGTQPARRKSVRINPDPPEMSATPAATPAIELDEEPKWSQGQNGGGSGSGGWATRIGRSWEDSSEESGEDEEYERVRRALATSYKHLDAVNVPNSRGREKEKGKSRR